MSIFQSLGRRRKGRPQDSSSRQQFLIDVARSLNAAVDSEQLIDEIISKSTDLIGCEICSILFPSEAQPDHLVIRSTRDRDNPIEVPVERSIAGEVFRSKKLLRIDDVQAYGGHNRSAAKKMGIVTKAMITVPLLDGETCIGVLQAINPSEGSIFNEHAEETIEIFASLISISRIRILAQEVAIRQAQTRRELDLAHEIQESFLPPERDVVHGFPIEAFY
ncbi:MAG: GAF domain-containing protein, partial [Verrucomicrobiota bacterium]